MQIDLLNFNATIKEENIMEVTNPVYFNKGSLPTDDGLFSYTIFGRPGSKERKEKWGYINLKTKFVHPSIFGLLKSLNRNLENIMLCKKFYVINQYGELVEDNENGETGPDFLYRNFNKISFKEGNTRSRSKKLSLLVNLKRDEIFIDKWLICPAFYRDVNVSDTGKGRQMVDDINKMYSKLIMYNNNIMESDSEYSFTGLATKTNIQLLLNDIYFYFVDTKISKKKGYIHKGLLGKTVDYSTRSVISAPRFTSNFYQDQEVMFGYTGIPLTQLVVLFYPFYVNYIQGFMKQHEMDAKLISTSNKKETKNVPLGDIFNESMIKKLLELFVKAEAFRFQTLCVEDETGKIYRLEMFKDELERDFTLMDLIFLATDEIVADKHVYVTRYPIESTASISPTKISILSTRKTEHKTVNNKYFKNYPHVIPDYPSTLADLVCTVIPNNSYLTGYGGDYDGDQVSLRGVYSKEANAEAEKKIYEKVNFLNTKGELNRDIGKEGMLALYVLTMD